MNLPLKSLLLSLILSALNDTAYCEEFFSICFIKIHFKPSRDGPGIWVNVVDPEIAKAW
jgi:hypothetical protein